MEWHIKRYKMLLVCQKMVTRGENADTVDKTSIILPVEYTTRYLLLNILEAKFSPKLLQKF